MIEKGVNKEVLMGKIEVNGERWEENRSFEEHLGGVWSILRAVLGRGRVVGSLECLLSGPDVRISNSKTG